MLYLEDIQPLEDLARLLEGRAAENPRLISGGAILERPKAYCVPINRSNMDELASLVEQLELPWIAGHVHVYSGEEVLLIWYDACWEDHPISVSKHIPEERLNAFCSELGVSYEAV